MAEEDPVKVTVIGVGRDVELPDTPFAVKRRKGPIIDVGYVAELDFREALGVDPESMSLPAGAKLAVDIDRVDLGELGELRRLVEHPRLRGASIVVRVKTGER